MWRILKEGNLRKGRECQLGKEEEEEDQEEGRGGETEEVEVVGGREALVRGISP